MTRLPRIYQWLALLVIMTSTPGVGELFEGVAHMALELSGAVEHDEHGHCGAIAGHDDDDSHCGDSCPAGGCTRGFFHSCRADAPALATVFAPHLVDVPPSGLTSQAVAAAEGAVLPGHARMVFRPPCA